MPGAVKKKFLIPDNLNNLLITKNSGAMICPGILKIEIVGMIAERRYFVARCGGGSVYVVCTKGAETRTRHKLTKLDRNYLSKLVK